MIKRWLTIMISALVLISISSGVWRVFAQTEKPLAELGTAFTYQGYLTIMGEPASGVFDKESTIKEKPD